MATTLVALVALVAIVSAASPASARREFGSLYNDGEIMRTFGVPAPLPHGGNDPLFMVTNGVSAQLGIAAVAPGDPGYNGGAWAVYMVTFNSGVTPYLLTSDEDVHEAEMAGDVTVVRDSSRDFRCPVQP
jgi:hypothetical protein